MGKNLASAENGKKSRFTSGNQPKKRGRLKSIFGPLARENNLSLDDVRKIYKNILTAKGTENLNEIKEKYPSMLTNMTIDLLKQDMLGRLTGRKITIKRDGEEKEIEERIKSYETIQYMLDRIFGSPAKTDLTVMNQTDIFIGEPPLPEEAYPD
jgi:hypothetical protein